MRTRYYLYCLLFMAPGWALAQDSTRVSKDSLPAFGNTPKADTVNNISPDSVIRYRINGTYLKSIVQDLGFTASRPFHWQGRDFAKFGVVVGTAGLLMAGDYEVKQFFERNHTKGLTEITNQIEPFGNAYSPYLIGVLYVTGVVSKNRNLEHASLMAAKSLLISTALYTTAKIFIRRQRPTTSDNPFSYSAPFNSDSRYTSFPSGHTLTVTTVATAFAEIYGKDYPWVPWAAYGLATLTGVTRLYQNRHWSSDIWIGASLGWFVTRTVIRNQRRHSKKGTYSLQVVP
ncbi:MAG TPA: phosphatase PAP2 family protein [Chitinophaga sp.]|uniref:phosphatase PAP2 family protein n=1 Tax=Chitinophaga sp. TaxID=1869181 RepID=UPI002DBC7C84|nr:phosphatase PAP2 family protein [Chitinophaga sp.]HEU4551859.1 phosphatase PAP2 family protein [Chitinophaga sp.]